MQRATASSFCCSVNWRLVLVGLVIDGQSDGHGVTLRYLSTERGEAQSQPDRILQLLPDLAAAAAPDDGGYRFVAPVFKTREYRPEGVFLATDPGSELPALLLQAQMRADPKFLLRPALADPDAPPLLRTLALLLETEERLPTITAQIRARVAGTALVPQIADATAAIQLARFTTRAIPEICAMNGITLEDFGQIVAYMKIFRLR
jgi:hypothetical protein